LAPLVNWQATFLITALADIHKCVPVMWEQVRQALREKGVTLAGPEFELSTRDLSSVTFEQLIAEAPETPCVSPFGELEHFLICALHQAIAIHTMVDYTLHLATVSPELQVWYSSLVSQKLRLCFEQFEQAVWASRSHAQHIPRWFSGRDTSGNHEALHCHESLFGAWFRFVTGFLTNASGKHQRVWQYLGWHSPRSPRR
jgi:hypothetical protein